jgi:hypothetical protein
MKMREDKKIPSEVGPRTGKSKVGRKKMGKKTRVSERTSVAPGRQGGVGGRGVVALTGTGAEISAETNDGREKIVDPVGVGGGGEVGHGHSPDLRDQEHLRSS